MTQDEIIEMAQECKLIGMRPYLDGIYAEALEAFAKMVAAKRTWVGLTDDEFNELYDRYVPITCYALLIEKVEAKLKEKNCVG
jgi:hypothetical protein